MDYRSVGTVELQRHATKFNVTAKLHACGVHVPYQYFFAVDASSHCQWCCHCCLCCCWKRCCCCCSSVCSGSLSSALWEPLCHRRRASVLEPSHSGRPQPAAALPAPKTRNQPFTLHSHIKILSIYPCTLHKIIPAPISGQARSTHTCTKVFLNQEGNVPKSFMCLAARRVTALVCYAKSFHSWNLGV